MILTKVWVPFDLEVLMKFGIFGRFLSISCLTFGTHIFNIYHMTHWIVTNFDLLDGNLNDHLLPQFFFLWLLWYTKMRGFECRPFFFYIYSPLAPQVRPKMNDKRPSKFQFYFSGVLEAFSMLRKWKKKIVSLDFGDNPIYPISNPDGQDREV